MKDNKILPILAELEPRVDILRTLINTIEEYIKTIQGPLESNDPARYNEIKQKIMEANANITRAYSLKDRTYTGDKEMLEVVNAMYLNANPTYNTAMNIYETVLSPVYFTMMSNVSPTTGLRLLSYREQIAKLIEDYQKEVLRDDVIVRHVGDLVNVSKSPTMLYDFVMRFGVINETNNLMMYSVRLLLKYMVVAKTDRLRGLLEREKDKLLGSDNRRLIRYDGVQSIIVRNGLHPITKSMTIRDMFAMLKIDYDDTVKPEDNFALCKQAFAVIYSSCSSPIEFDFTGLLSIERVKRDDLITSPVAGLNNKILERFNTTRDLGRTDVKPKEMGTYNLVENMGVYVVQTINGKHYRLLGTNSDGIPSQYPVGVKDYQVKSTATRAFSQGLTMRPHMYNDACARDIIKYCKGNYQLILQNYANEKLVVGSADPLKKLIIDQMIEYTAESLKLKMPSGVPALKKQIIDLTAIGTILTQSMLKLRPALQHPESQISYIVKYERVYREFVRELTHRWDKEFIPDRLFKELNSYDLRTNFVNIQTAIVTAVCEDLDRNNLWSDVISLKEYINSQGQ